MRHPSESVVLRRDGRCVNHGGRMCPRIYAQAHRQDESTETMTMPRFVALLLIGGLSWLCLFYGFMLIAGVSQ